MAAVRCLLPVVHGSHQSRSSTGDKRISRDSPGWTLAQAMDGRVSPATINSPVNAGTILRRTLNGRALVVLGDRGCLTPSPEYGHCPRSVRARARDRECPAGMPPDPNAYKRPHNSSPFDLSPVRSFCTSLSLLPPGNPLSLA